MTKLNDPGSPLRTANTGNPSNIMVPKKIVGAMLVPYTYAVSAANCATSSLFITEMQKIILAEPTTRGYPIGPFTDNTPKTEEDVYVKSNYGVSTFVRDGKIGWAFAMTAGGIGLQKNLRAFNQTKAHKLFFWDSDKTWFGVDDGAGGMKGFEIEDFHAKAWSVNDGAKPAGFNVEILFANTSELADDINFIKLDSHPNDIIKGLIDVVLEKVSSSSTHAFIRLMTKAARINLFDQYSADLDAAAAWYAETDGTEVTISAVTANPATKDFDLTLTVGATTTIQLETPAILDGLNVGGPPNSGYESNRITITDGSPQDRI